MTVSVIEGSAYGGSPLEFFKFRYGTTYHFQVASTQDEVGPLLQVYTHKQISREMNTSSSELNKNPLELIVDQSNEVTRYFRTGQPDEIIFLSMYLKHQTDVDEEYILAWQGRVSNCKFEGDLARLVCEPVSASAKRLGLRAKYQKLCRHALYDDRCQATPLQENVTVTLVSPGSITVSGISQADNFYRGGYLQLSNGQMRMVTSQLGGLLELSHAFNSISAGLTGTIIAGCDHSRASCRDKFNNFLNFGGFPYIPTKNPFTDGPINQ